MVSPKILYPLLQNFFELYTKSLNSKSAQILIVTQKLIVTLGSIVASDSHSETKDSRFESGC